MSKKKLCLIIFYLIFFVIILAIFTKILLNANNLQLKITNNFVPKLYHAKYEPIKIVPESDINLRIDKNEKIYEFIDKEEWQFKPKVNNQRNKVIRKEIKYDKKIISAEKTPQKIINYKKHNIHIVKTDRKKKPQYKHNKISIQLGAFTTYNKALLEQERLHKLLAKITTSHNFIIEKAKIKNKNIIYRLKITPFKNISKAKKLCTNIRKKSIACFLSN